MAKKRACTATNGAVRVEDPSAASDGKRQKITKDPRTISLAVPGSVIENAQTTELATTIAGQLARAAAIFNIDEIVVLDDSPGGEVGRGAAFLSRILQYLETPQYLRKSLIPLHDDLRHAGLLPPLDAPHHMRATEWCRFRDGVVKSSAVGEGSTVDVGLDKEAHVNQALRPGVRVTLDMGDKTGNPPSEQFYSATLTSGLEPRIQEGIYWGYRTRIASNVEALKAGCPFKGGYDLTVGTSEHGTKSTGSGFSLPPFQHLLVVFGGPHGLEDWFSKDRTTKSVAPNNYFDMYINTCADQGSRTIRTEEAVLISLAYLQPALSAS